MKNTVLALLATILVVALVNLLANLGVFGSADGGSHAGADFEYKALNGRQMDSIGFQAVAEEEGIEKSEKGELNFPKEVAPQLSKTNLLPRTIREVEKDGGWTFVAVTGDDHYLFRRPRTGLPQDEEEETAEPEEERRTVQDSVDQTGREGGGDDTQGGQEGEDGG